MPSPWDRPARGAPARGRDGDHARALFPETQPSPSRSIAAAAAMVRQRGESGSTGPAPGPDATPSPTTAVAALMGFDTGRDVPAARSPPPASSAATREGTPRRGDEHPTSSSSPMTDILNVFAADAAPRAPPAGAGASQAAANVRRWRPRPEVQPLPLASRARGCDARVLNRPVLKPYTSVSG